MIFIHNFFDINLFPTSWCERLGLLRTTNYTQRVYNILHGSLINGYHILEGQVSRKFKIFRKFEFFFGSITPGQAP